MAIKFQYNKTSLGDLGKQLKMRQKALPTIKSKESALRSEVKKAKDSAGDYRRRLDALKAEYDQIFLQGGSCDQGGTHQKVLERSVRHDGNQISI